MINSKRALGDWRAGHKTHGCAEHLAHCSCWEPGRRVCFQLKIIIKIQGLLAQVRSQTVHILHITDSGKLVVSQKLGTFCRDDDELALSRCREAEQTFHSQVEVCQMRS